MKTIKLEIDLEYNDEIFHSGDSDKEAKEWFFELLTKPDEALILWCNEIGDEIGIVKNLIIKEVVQ
jgi:hypothetical protein